MYKHDCTITKWCTCDMMVHVHVVLLSCNIPNISNRIWADEKFDTAAAISSCKLDPEFPLPVTI